MPFRSDLITALSSIPAPLGKFAVTGNHEYYTGLEEALEFTRQAGFSPLRNQHVLVKDVLAIVGMDDTGHDDSKISEAKVLGDLVKKHFTLLLKHRPVVNQDSLDRFDLQLSGHTHKGQMYPFTVLVDMFFALKSGTHQVSELSRIHVSRGTGTWGPPFRVLAPPEVTIINLLPAEAPPADVPSK
jgi:predicted MPP superfamily phosphohydrolase